MKKGDIWGLGLWDFAITCEIHMHKFREGVRVTQRSKPKFKSSFSLLLAMRVRHGPYPLSPHFLIYKMEAIEITLLYSCEDVFSPH